jgi:putative membrane protein
VSSLDDPRVYFAAERTLLAWQRTAMALMGFGFVVERFGLFLRALTNQPLSGAHRGFSLWLGVGLLGVGGAVAVVSALQFRTFVRSLGPAELPRGYRIDLGPWINYVLALAAFGLAAYFLASA